MGGYPPLGYCGVSVTRGMQRHRNGGGSGGGPLWRRTSDFPRGTHEGAKEESGNYPMPYKAHARNAKARAAPQLKAGNLSKDETERIDRKADRKHDDSAAIQSLHPQHTERADRGMTGRVLLEVEPPGSPFRRWCVRRSGATADG